MNVVVLRALFLDAWYQVLDNRVFRAVAFLTALPIALSFAVGFREEELVILFGWKEIQYAELFRMFDMNVGTAGLGQARALMIETLADRVVGFLTGSLGVVVALAATAFFVPRTLERGAAEVLFARPIPRVLVYASRYVAGLLFVGLLSAVLLSGVFAGLRVSSDYSYFGLFWALPTVLYVFAVVHAISMMIGVWTRSSPAAILLTLAFFIGNGCVHTGWKVKETLLGEVTSPADEPGPTLQAFYSAVDGAHLVLPKTGDADEIVDIIRGADETDRGFPMVVVDGEPADVGPALTWGGDLGSNILYSIASTVAFTLVVLAIGWRKLERIDF